MKYVCATEQTVYIVNQIKNPVPRVESCGGRLPTHTTDSIDVRCLMSVKKETLLSCHLLYPPPAQLPEKAEGIFKEH